MNAITDLLQHKRLIWRGSEQQAGPDSLSSGHPALDQALNGGLPKHGVVEVSSQTGIGELRLLLPHIRQQCQKKLAVFINPPANLCAGFFAQQKFNLDQVLQISPQTPQHALWATEQCLKSGTCGTVSLWHPSLEVHQARRLQVASETGKCLHFFFKTEHTQQTSLPVSLNLTLTARDNGLHVAVSKRKGGWLKNNVNLDMSALWPSLTRQAEPTQVLPFPALQQGRA